MLKRRGLIIHPEELDEIWLHEIKQAGINVLGLHPVGGHEAAYTLAQAVKRHHTPEFQALLTKANEHGLTVEYEAHALGYLMPRAEFAQHPDWFRMDEQGQRTADFNLCPSNEEALQYLENASEALTRTLDTGSDRFFWWTDDVGGKSCHCPRCRHLSPSDQFLLITNAIQRGARRAKPTARVPYLAYVDALAVPRTIEPEEGVFLEYAPFIRDSHRPMDDEACSENVAQAAPLRDLLAFFGRDNAQVLEYWIDNSRFSQWTKPPKYMTLEEEVMRRDVAFYEKLGFESITSFACYLGADYRALYGLPPIGAYGRILNG